MIYVMPVSRKRSYDRAVPTKIILRGGGEIAGVVGWLEEIQAKVDAARLDGEAWLELERELSGNAQSGHRDKEPFVVAVADIVAISGLKRASNAPD